MGNCELPEDVVFQILLVLPAVSLLRFRSVCKSWNALIDSSTFITRHRLLHAEHDDSIIAQEYQNNSWYLLSGESHLCIDISAQLRHLCNQKFEHWSMVGSCHGLICIEVLLMDRVTLWNPATRHLSLLPESPVPIEPKQGTRSIYGFGYAIKTNCYKVIKLTRVYNRDRRRFDNTRVEIYNLQSDSWRTDTIDITGQISIFGGVYWNGLYYWSMNNWPAKRTFSLISFDLSDEVLGVVAFPDPDVLSTYWFPRQLIVEFGIKESWTKLYTIGPTIGGVLPAGFFSNGDFFFYSLMKVKKEYKNFLGWCNPVIQEIQYIPAPYATTAFVYKESLVSVKKGNGASSVVS